MDLGALGWGFSVLDRTLKSQATKIDKADIITVKNFYVSKGRIMNVKRQPTDWVRIATNHLTETCNSEYIKNFYNSIAKRQANFKMGIGTEQTSWLLRGVARGSSFTKHCNPFPQTVRTARRAASGTEVRPLALPGETVNPDCYRPLSLTFEEIQLQDSGEADATMVRLREGQSPGPQWRNWAATSINGGKVAYFYLIKRLKSSFSVNIYTTHGRNQTSLHQTSQIPNCPVSRPYYFIYNK